MRITDMILSDSEGREKGFVTQTAQLDLDIGDTDDFELQMALSDYMGLGLELGDRIYLPDTEYGGLVEDKETSTYEDAVFLRGYTWRGLLSQKIICPEEGNENITVSGEANAVIDTLIQGWFDGLIRVDHTDSGIMIDAYEIPAYTNGLDGLTEMLKSKGARLEITYEQQKYSGQAVIRAVPVIDYSENIEYSNDNKVHFTTRDYRMGINHLICLGKDETDKTIAVHLYAGQNGTVSEIQTYYGTEERTAVYELSSEKDRSKLIESGKKKIMELADYKELGTSIQDVEVAVGDIVGGRERTTGLYMRQPVTNKILKLDNSKESIEYKVGE